MTIETWGGTDREDYWNTLLVVAYQYIESEDDDPTGEPNTPGMTVSGGIIPIYPSFSSVFMEGIREHVMLAPPIGANAESLVSSFLNRAVAHEIAHAPGHGNDEDHEEGGIMSYDASSDDFSPSTIRRFKETLRWQK